MAGKNPMETSYQTVQHIASDTDKKSGNYFPPKNPKSTPTKRSKTTQ
jgi:hypothetical protein